MAAEFRPQRLVDSIMLFSSSGGINNQELFNKALREQHFRGQPIQIAGFIGQGGKDHLGRSDIDLLAKYSRLKEELNQNYPFGVEISLIGADAHGWSNSMPDYGYLDLMQNEARSRDFNWIILSDLYRDKGLILPTWTEASRQLYDRQGEGYEAWLKINSQIREDLIKQAGKHHQLDEHIGERSSNVLSAFYYFLMRKQEEKIFIPDWKNFLFVINGSRELAEHTFPQSIAQMYWYDTRHHGGRKSRGKNENMILPPPWFRND